MYDNPADLLSRGIAPGELEGKTIWKRSPSWLPGGEENWLLRPMLEREEIPEQRNSTCLVANASDGIFLKQYSFYRKLQRIVALCRRFLPSMKHKGLLNDVELKAATVTVL